MMKGLPTVAFDKSMNFTKQNTRGVGSCLTRLKKVCELFRKCHIFQSCVKCIR